MLEHIVLLRLKKDAPETSKQELLAALLGLKTRVPGVLDVTGGANVSERSHGYTHGFVFRFPDAAALDKYLVHPEHVAVVDKHVRPLAESILVVDFAVA